MIHHLEWTVAKGGGAHSFRWESGCFLYDQAPCAGRGQRYSATGENQVAGILQAILSLLDMVSPVRKILFNGVRDRFKMV